MAWYVSKMLSVGTMQLGGVGINWQYVPSYPVPVQSQPQPLLAVPVGTPLFWQLCPDAPAEQGEEEGVSDGGHALQLTGHFASAIELV